MNIHFIAFFCVYFTRFTHELFNVYYYKETLCQPTYYYSERRCTLSATLKAEILNYGMNPR